MTIEETLVTHLENDAGVAALVGARIYPLVAPQDASRPYLVYQRISTPRVRSQSGPSGLASPRFQITAVAATYSSLRGLANAVRAALDGSRIAQAVFVVNEADAWEDGAEVYTSQIDVVIWHEET